MDSEVRFCGDSADLIALRRWLNDEPALRSRVRLIQSVPREGDLGSLPEILTVGVTIGGPTAAALARSFNTWLKTRVTHAKITIEVEGKPVSIDLNTTETVMPLLNQLLQIPNEPED